MFGAMRTIVYSVWFDVWSYENYIVKCMVYGAMITIALVYGVVFGAMRTIALVYGVLFGAMRTIAYSEWCGVVGNIYNIPWE